MTGMMDSFFIFFLPRNLLTSYQISVAQGENSEIKVFFFGSQNICWKCQQVNTCDQTQMNQRRMQTTHENDLANIEVCVSAKFFILSF